MRDKNMFTAFYFATFFAFLLVVFLRLSDRRNVAKSEYLSTTSIFLRVGQKIAVQIGCQNFEKKSSHFIYNFVELLFASLHFMDVSFQSSGSTFFLFDFYDDVGIPF